MRCGELVQIRLRPCPKSPTLALCTVGLQPRKGSLTMRVVGWVSSALVSALALVCFDDLLDHGV